VNDRQLGERLRQALEAERPPAVPAAEVRQRAGAQQQRRELEEIRRHFAEVGRRTGSAFAPATPEEDRWAVAQPFTSPLDRPRRPPWQWAAAVVLVFLLGAGFGALLPGAGPNDRPAASAASPPTTPAPATTQAPQAPTVPTVPEPCLETARTGDQVIALLTRAKRNPSLLSEALQEYSLASQACRKAASP
jgi:hypothetical protein